MTAPYGNTGGPKKSRGTGSQIPAMSADDSLEVEAYGAKGAALRRTAAQFGNAQSESNDGPSRMKQSLSNAVSGVVNAVKRVVKTDRK